MAINKRNLWQFLGSAIGRIVLLAIIGLFLFNIGRLIYANYQINNQIDELKNQISMLEDEKINLENQILYYKTDTYKELELRSHLGYQFPDEKVVILYKNKNTNEIISQENQNNTTSDSGDSNSTDTTPNWQKWWDFIFG